MVFHIVLMKLLNLHLFANKRGSFGGGVPFLDILSIFEAFLVKNVKKCNLNDFLYVKPGEMVKTNAKVPK